MFRRYRLLSNAFYSRSYTQRSFDWDSKTSAEHYLRSSPPYSPRVIPWILEYYFRNHSDSDFKGTSIPMAIDVGCASGQLTTELAKFCDRVTGIDSGEPQIELGRTASHRPNVEYMLGRAESFSEKFDPGSVDLVTAGESAHFFDTDKFFAEAYRCLRPRGVIGLVGYFANGYRHDNEDMKYAFDNFLNMQCSHIPNFETALKRLHGRYRSFDFPFHDIHFKEDTFDVEWSLDHAISFFESGKHLYRYPGLKIPFPRNGNDPDTKATVRFNIFAVLGCT